MCIGRLVGCIMLVLTFVSDNSEKPAVARMPPLLISICFMMATDFWHSNEAPVVSWVLSYTAGWACGMIAILVIFVIFFHIPGHASYLLSVCAPDRVAEFECGGGKQTHAVSNHFCLQVGVQCFPCFVCVGQVHVAVFRKCC
jgi:hypothetical protein